MPICYVPWVMKSSVESMDHLAFLPTEDVPLTIEGAKYPLNETNFFFKKSI